MARELVVVALGGNALVRADGDGSWGEAVRQMRRTAPALAEIVARGHRLVLTHGNGPQVGMMLRQNELAQRDVPPRPLDVLGAESAGQIGYLIAQELGSALVEAAVPRSVLCLLSRMEVAPRDPAFHHPSKPIGQFYSEGEARLLRKERGWTMLHDPARGGWRRLVPSPRPVRWVEGAIVRRLLHGPLGAAAVWVLGGGGGIPVVARGRGRLEGVEAVIDKDFAAEGIATALGASTLAMVTDVPGVAVGFRRPWERWLGAVGARRLARYRAEGEFGEGSMEPKVEAALRFVRHRKRRAVITDVSSLPRALAGEAGTQWCVTIC
jgi:carbamate kinase